MFHPRAEENPYHQPTLDFHTSALTRAPLTGHGLKVIDFLFQDLQESVHHHLGNLPYPSKNDRSIGTTFHRESNGFRVGERFIWKDASLEMRFGMATQTISQPRRSWLKIIDPKHRDLISAARQIRKSLDDTAQPMLDSARRGLP